MGHGLLKGHDGDCRSVGPSIGSTARCRGWFAGFTGKEFVPDILSVGRACIRVGDMVIILAAVAERAIVAVGKCVTWVKTFGAEFGSAAYVTAVSGSAVGAYIFIYVVVHMLGRCQDCTVMKHGVSFEPIFCIGYGVEADLHGCR